MLRQGWIWRCPGDVCQIEPEPFRQLEDHVGRGEVPGDVGTQALDDRKPWVEHLLETLEESHQESLRRVLVDRGHA